MKTIITKVLLSLFFLCLTSAMGCGGGGIVDNGAPVTVSGEIAEINVGGRKFNTLFPSGEWDPSEIVVPTTDSPVRYTNGDRFIEFRVVDTTSTCAVSPISTNANQISVYECSSTLIQLVTPEAVIVEATHNLSKEDIAIIANSFRELPGQ